QQHVLLIYLPSGAALAGVLALARCFQHCVAEKCRLRGSGLLPEGDPISRYTDRTKQRRHHASRKCPTCWQGEMQPCAGACLERKESNQRAFFIEQAATALSRL